MLLSLESKGTLLKLMFMQTLHMNGPLQYSVIQCYIITVLLYKECYLYIDECFTIYNQFCAAPLPSVCTAL